MHEIGFGLSAHQKANYLWGQMPTYDARSVANMILDFAEADGFRLTQMSLLKIVYFAHGWYLAIYDRPLILQEFEAWEYGPVVKVVRDEFSIFKKSPITARAYKFDLISGKREIPDKISDQNDVDFIRNIYREYNHYSSWKLSEMTHERGSPWDRVWNSSIPTGRLGLRLKNSEIKRHFSRLLSASALS
jgi:uncharacterized phage-associated protein